MKGPFSTPDAQSRYLAQANLPPPRLAIPVPVQKNAPWYTATRLWIQDITTALVAQGIPAVELTPRQGDWWLATGAIREDGGIKARYALMGPDGKVRASGTGPLVDLAGWRAGNPETLNATALAIAPQIRAQLTGIQAQQMQDDPASLKNRAARICFKGVSGAKGDGNLTLGRSFYANFPAGRNRVQTSADQADYFVDGHVKYSPLPSQPDGSLKELVEITWRVSQPGNREIGAATQLHAVNLHSLDANWGDSAQQAGQEAANAVNEIISNYSGRMRRPLPKLSAGDRAREGIRPNSVWPGAPPPPPRG